MQLQKASLHILKQLADLVREIHPSDFHKPSVWLNQSTIGQHLRHTLEFFACLQQGYESGLINYDLRARESQMESDKQRALNVIESIIEFVKNVSNNMSLQMEFSYEGDEQLITTNLYRELIYNLEHAVHHMAIMKIAMPEIAPYIVLPPDFGIALSTIQYHKNQTVKSHLEDN